LITFLPFEGFGWLCLVYTLVVFGSGISWFINELLALSKKKKLLLYTVIQILLNIRKEDVVVKPKLPFWTRVSCSATST